MMEGGGRRGSRVLRVLSGGGEGSWMWQPGADLIGGVHVQCPNEFVVGYGLDHNEQYRSLPYVGVLKPERYSGED